MISPTRVVINDTMRKYATRLGLENIDILEIGIDGDDKPSGSHKYFGEGNRWDTMDFLDKTEPDYLFDITGFDDLPNKKWDLIICIQTLEHIFDIHRAFRNISDMVKPGGYVILDNPWHNQYHTTDDYDDYWRMSLVCMARLCDFVGMEMIDGQQHEHYVSILAKKI